ncbi:MAG TPA: iron-containing alcohol dehydrogenase [Candidatus Binataceae bacterium]|jgi:alcohol dehydrogenase|nr:iron-containing alcohol dehydrogenase [Candidatus Binataceae bacterium]
MDPVAGEFNFTRLEKVVFGPGKVAGLGRELERRGLKRALIVTGKTLGRSPLLDKVTSAAGARLAGVFKGAGQHVPSATVGALVEEYQRSGADCMVSFGGGSPIDTVKVAAKRILEGSPPKGADAHTIDFESAMAGAAGGPDLIHVALPTTLSAGEYTPVGGVTDEASHIKGGVSDPRLQPRTIFLDPELTVETPAWLWAATGMRALDHAVEASYSTRHQPLTDALAARAIALLTTHLTASLKTTGAESLAHRGQCQLAAWFSIFGAMNTRFGISHALGHQIGPMWNVPHGVTSCITLPHVMRYMAGVAPERFGPIAEGFGVRFDPANPKPAALECAERTARFIAHFEVPNRLRDAGVPREELGAIAATVLDEVERAQTVGRPITRDDLLRLLEAAY